VLAKVGQGCTEALLTLVPLAPEQPVEMGVLFLALAEMILTFLLINNLINNLIIKRFVAFHQDSSAKDRWIGAYSVGLTFPIKLGCPRKIMNHVEIIVGPMLKIYHVSLPWLF
jgi:hypothetical protein